MLESGRFLFRPKRMHCLPKSLPDFKKASILVIGDIMLDRYWFGDTARISPEAPVPIVKINSIDHRPGGAGNVALNISALGATVTLAGLTGNDEAAHTLKSQLENAGVNHQLCISEQLSTIIKLRIISKHQQLIRLDFENKFTEAHQDILFQAVQQYISNQKLIILSDYNKGTLTNPQLFIDLARQHNIPVLVDPKGTDFNIYKNATIITPNLKEFEQVVGPCRTDEEMINKGRNLLAAHHISSLLITRGEYGMTFIDAQQAIHFPAYAREVFDVTGAGDTVIGVLGSAFAAGLDLISATALANLAAGLVVGKLGAATISTAELEAALAGKMATTTGILTEAQLLENLSAIRSQGKKIVFTNGCFDLLHAGHVASLQMAKQLGDYLIVAVNTDESIKRIKGPHRPINSLEHRMAVLAGLNAVDCVVPFAEDTPERLLQIIRPDILVKGGDYRINEVVGADIVRAYGGEVRVMAHNIMTSSSEILNRIQSLGGVR